MALDLWYWYGIARSGMPLVSRYWYAVNLD